MISASNQKCGRPVIRKCNGRWQPVWGFDPEEDSCRLFDLEFCEKEKSRKKTFKSKKACAEKCLNSDASGRFRFQNY